MVNEDSASFHDLVVDRINGWEGFNLDTNAGETHSVNIQMPPVEISTTFFCSVLGHKEAGMYGNFLIVDPETSVTTETSGQEGNISSSSSIISLTPTLDVPLTNYIIISLIMIAIAKRKS